MIDARNGCNACEPGQVRTRRVEEGSAEAPYNSQTCKDGKLPYLVTALHDEARSTKSDSGTHVQTSNANTSNVYCYSQCANFTEHLLSFSCVAGTNHD
eukprot:6267978-Amphidinium_carterae.1